MYTTYPTHFILQVIYIYILYYIILLFHEELQIMKLLIMQFFLLSSHIPLSSTNIPNLFSLVAAQVPDLYNITELWFCTTYFNI